MIQRRQQQAGFVKDVRFDRGVSQLLPLRQMPAEFTNVQDANANVPIELRSGRSRGGDNARPQRGHDLRV